MAHKELRIIAIGSGRSRNSVVFSGEKEKIFRLSFTKIFKLRKKLKTKKKHVQKFKKMERHRKNDNIEINRKEQKK